MAAGLAAFCNPKGRIIASLRLWRYEAKFFLLLPNNNLGHTLSILQRYAIFSKVTLQDVSNEWFYYGAVASHAETLPGANELQIDNTQFCLGLPTDGACAYLLSRNELTPNEAQTSWQQLLIQNKLPMITALSCEKFTPHDLELPKLGAVSFTKGCYVGQEIIARMEHLGKPKRKLYYAYTDLRTAPAVASKIICDGKTVGHVLQAVIHNSHCHLLLVLNKDAASQQSLYFDDTEISLLEQ